MWLRPEQACRRRVDILSLSRQVSLDAARIQSIPQVRATEK